MNIKFPKNENICVTYLNADGEAVCVMTERYAGDLYYLYEVLPTGEIKKLGKGSSPNELEEKFKVSERMTK